VPFVFDFAPSVATEAAQLGAVAAFVDAVTPSLQLDELQLEKVMLVIFPVPASPFSIVPPATEVEQVIVATVVPSAVTVRTAPGAAAVAEMAPV
jgi:hypothetical protein